MSSPTSFDIDERNSRRERQRGFMARSAGDFLRNLRKLPAWGASALRCVQTFEHPREVLREYWRGAPPGRETVPLRNGMRIAHAGGPEDLVTLFLIFARRDYGRMRPGSRVIDIGANIGAFSLYAASLGAAAVHAYEPCSESFALLTRNVEANGLSGVITPRRLVAAGRDREQAAFPRKSSVYNRAANDAGPGTDLVATVSLATIVDEHCGGETVDLLKIDCEGGEYDLLLCAPNSAFRRIQRIRMEYHQGGDGRVDRLIQRLQAAGYSLTWRQDDSPGLGQLWFDREREGENQG